jgi:hypothetical protein
MPYLRRNNSPCNGDIRTVLLQKRPEQHWQVENNWHRSFGTHKDSCSLIGSLRARQWTETPTVALWPVCAAEFSSEERVSGPRKCSCCTTMLTHTHPNRQGLNWMNLGTWSSTSSLLSRFIPLRLCSLWQNEGAFKGQNIHWCRCPARGCPPVVSHYVKRPVPGGHHDACTTMASMHRTAGRLRWPFLKLPHFCYASYFNQEVSIIFEWPEYLKYIISFICKCKISIFAVIQDATYCVSS